MAVRSAAQLILDYDQEGDVLYASLGPPQHAITEEVDDDILLRYSPPSRDIVGITIVNFRRHFPHEAPVDVIRRVLRQYPVVPRSCDDQ